MSVLSGISAARRGRRRRVVFSAVLLFLLTVTSFSRYSRTLPSFFGYMANEDLTNATNPGAKIGLEDVVLVIKTGATESLKKIPAHVNTTLRSWPHVLLLSDFAEQINGYQLHDALDAVSEDIRLRHASFELWRRLRDRGRSGLASSEPELNEQLLWQPAVSDRQEGWRLARFMNLPMAAKALMWKPAAKWFMFIDADTFVSKTNVLEVLRHLDSTKPMYMGSQVAMGPGEFFAHGGSGYMLSHSAIVTVVQQYEAAQMQWDSQAVSQEFGEVVLARALLEMDISLTWGFPIFQGGNPSEMNFGASEHGRMTWCYPAISYHHVHPQVIDELSRFENTRSQRSEHSFRHSDVFREWLLPQLHYDGRSDWDNLSRVLVQGVSNESSCQAACQQNLACVQFAFYENECRIDGVPKLGRPRAGAMASWDLERVHQVASAWDRQCKDMILV